MILKEAGWVVSVGMAHGGQKVFIVCYPGQGDEPGPLTLASAGSPVSQIHLVLLPRKDVALLGYCWLIVKNQFGDRLFDGLKLQLIENKNVSMKTFKV